MKKPSTKRLVKIGQAAKILGVSIDTLRRWEAQGKIRVIKTPGGTRYYFVKELNQRKPQVAERKQFDLLSGPLPDTNYFSHREPPKIVISYPQTPTLPPPQKVNPLTTHTPYLATALSVFFLAICITTLVSIFYLAQPTTAQKIFSQARFLDQMAQHITTTLSPQLTSSFSAPEQLALKEVPNVLAVGAEAEYLEINTDTTINGNLTVSDEINGIKIASASAGTTLNVSGAVTLNQNLSTTSSPTFADLNLSGTSKQIVFQSTGSTGTLTWTPTATRTITLPDATTTLVGTDTTQTLTNKSMSGSSNTFTNIPNSALSNNKVTVTAGTNMSGGGDVSLGSSITLSLAGSPAISGVLKLADGTAAAPALTFTDDTNTGLYRLAADKIGLITGGSATSGITIDSSGQVGIGIITPTSTLHVSGTGNITGNTTIGGTLAANGGTISTSASSLGFTDGTNTLFSVIDKGSYGFIRLSDKGSTGDPATCSAGDVYFNGTDGIFKACTATDAWANLTAGSSGTTGYWNRSGTTLSPATAGDAVTTSGNISTSGSGTITSASDLTAGGDLAVNGTTSADITSTTDTATVFNSAVTTLSLGGAATTLNLGITDGVTRTMNIGTGTGADTIHIGEGGTNANTITIGSDAVANTITIGSSSSTGVSITDNNWGVTTAGAGSFVTLSATPGTDTTALTLTGTNVATSNLAYLNAKNTSGTILNLAYGAAATLTGDLIGQAIDLNNGQLTNSNYSVTGLKVTLPTVTDSNATGTTNILGFQFGFGTGSGINQTGAGATIYSGVDVTLPAITQTAGTLTANGVSVTTSSSITTGGTANGVKIIPYTDGSLSNAGTLNGLNIGGITTGGASVTENAILVGTNWDNVLKVGSTTIINGSGVTQVAGGGTGIASYTAGDMIYASDTTTFTKLAGGTGNNGKVLVVSSGVPTWGTMAGSSCTDCVLNDPTSVTTQTITPNNQDISTLIVRQTTYATPTQNIFEVTNKDNTSKYFYVDKDGNVSTGAISNTTLTLTPTTDTTALTLVGTNVTTQPLQYINTKNSQASSGIFKLAYGAAQTLSTSVAVTGILEDLATNVTATDATVKGVSISLPGATNTANLVTNCSDSNCPTIKGLVISGSSINNTGTSTTTFTGADITIPPLTQTAGTLTGNGVLITTPTVTTGGTANAVNISASGIAVGTLNGINISNITAGSGTETALNIGTGWDTGISVGAIAGSATTSYGINIGANTSTGTTNYGLYVGAVSGATNNYAAIFAGGYVGIGTTTPKTQLQVDMPTGTYASIGGSNFSASDWFGLHVGYLEDGNLLYRKTMIAYEGLGDAQARGNLHLLVATANNSASATLSDSKLMISGTTGNVGIGTTAPDARLEINHATGDNLRLTYDDSNGSATNYTDFSLGTTGDLTITGSAATLGASATAEKTFLTLTPGTVTLTAPTQVTSLMETAVFTGATLAGDAALTVDKATTLSLVAPIDSTNVTLTDSSGLRILNTTSGAGTLTNQYGLYIEDMTAGGSDYGIAIEGADTAALWLSSAADNTDAANGITFGLSKDTNLYRSAANILKTDDYFQLADGKSFGGGSDAGANFLNFNGSTIMLQSASGGTVSLGYHSNTALLTADSRNTTSGVSTVAVIGRASTIASATGAEYTSFTVTPPTITLTGTTQVTSQMDSVLISAPTITDTSAVTVDKAATFTIAGAPTAAGSVTLTSPLALSVNAGNSYFGGNIGISAISPTSRIHLAYDSATTLAAALTGETLDLSTNVTNAAQSVTGASITLPITTAASTTTLKGISLSGGAFTTAAAATTSTWTGLDLTMPNITQGAGSTLTSTGLKITGGTVTSGTSYALITDANAGNVGIGSSAPVAALQIGGGDTYAGGNGPKLFITTPGTAGVTENDFILFTRAGRSAAVAGLDSSGAGDTAANNIFVIGTQSGKGGIDFRTTGDYDAGLQGGTSRLRILEGGNIGIASTAPDKALEINSATGVNLRLTYDDSNGSATNYTDFSLGTDGDLTINSSGNNTNITDDVAITTVATSGNGLTVTGNTVTTGNAVSVSATGLTSGNFLTMSADANRTAYSFAKNDATFAGQKDISSTGLANINGVFVYDTTKDNDGGKWTTDERARHSSWYNETIDATGTACDPTTNDRCGRKEFPEKAIIVITGASSQTGEGVYIFDAKDNTMWMKFDLSLTWKMQCWSGGSCENGSHVYAKNGVLYFGGNAGNGPPGEIMIDFIHDNGYQINGTNMQQFTNTIGTRNSSGASIITSTTMALPNAQINDTYVQVINGKTYVAVANNSAVSVINMTDSVVYDYDNGGLGHGTDNVQLTPDGTLYFEDVTTSDLVVFYNIQNDASDQTTADATYNEGSPSSGPLIWTSAPTINDIYVTYGTSTVDGKSNTIYIAHNAGLTVLQENQATPANGSVKYYDKDKITEEAIGNIKGLWTFDEAPTGGAGSITDRSINDADLTPTYNACTAGEAWAAGDQVTGVRGTGYSFNGDNDNGGDCRYLQAVDETKLRFTTTLSVGAWVKATSRVLQGIIDKSGNYYLYTEYNDFQWRIVDDGSAYGPSSSAATAGDFNANEWYFVVGTYDGTTVKLYLDGKLVGSTAHTASGGAIDTNNNQFQIGVQGGVTTTRIFNGTIDEPFATASVLTASEIQHMYQVGRRALDEHTASRITGVSGADNYQRLMGNASGGTSATAVAKAVAVDDSKQYIYVGLNDATNNTGGVTVLGVDSDSAVDLYDATANTGKKDDANTQFSASDVIGISLSGTPCPGYNSGSTACNNRATLAIAGTNDTATRVWMETSDLSLDATIDSLTSSALAKNNMTVNNLFRVFNTYNNITNTTTGEKIETPAFQIDQSGNLTYNYLGAATGNTAMTFTDATTTTGTTLSLTGSALTTGTLLNLTGDAITTGKGLALSVDGLTTGTGLDISSTSTAGTGSDNSKLLNLTRSGANASASHTAYGLYSAVTNTGTTNTNIAAYLSASGATTNYGLIVNAGSVGIGTTTPSYSLSGVGSLSTADSAVAAITNNNTTDSANTVTLRLNTGATSTTTNARFVTFYAGVTSGDTGGTAVGHINLNNNAVNYATSGADFGERFYVPEPTEPGDLIGVVNGQNGKAVANSTLIGVVSDTTGFTGNDNDNLDKETNPVVGLLGQIKTKVSTENGLIQIGDYLTSSSTPGVAMKATQPGQVIGKALEEFTSGETGKILVFISPGFADPQSSLANLTIDQNGALVVKDLALGTQGESLEPPVATTSLTDTVASISARLTNLENSATSSASLASLAPASDASLSGQLAVLDATISDTLKSLGQTFLGNTTIAGDLTVDGTLSFTGNSINSISTLYLQNNPLSDLVDIFNGKVTIDKEGILKATEVSTQTLTITGQDTIGSGKLLTGQTTVEIPSTLVSATTKIFITPKSSTGGQSLYIVTQNSGTGFTVGIDHSIEHDIDFDWWVIKTQ